MVRLTSGVGLMSAESRVGPFLSREFAIAPEHPALAGHFAGNPIVPGVTVLQRVLDLLEAALPLSRTVMLREVKFLRPLRPAEICAIGIRRIDGKTLAFDCRVERQLIARGTLVLGCQD